MTVEGVKSIDYRRKTISESKDLRKTDAVRRRHRDQIGLETLVVYAVKKA